MTEAGSALLVRVDLAGECLWRDGQRINVPPKAFRVLACLTSRPGELITKQQLIDEVWHGAFVTDVVLSVAIRQLREALGDDSKAPCYIETAHRRGFRWIGPASVLPTTEAAPTPGSTTVTCVGRSAVIAQLHDCYTRASSGQRQMIFVTGDPGIGKTTVIESFVASLRTSLAEAPLVCRGQCTESHIAGESYRAVLEAIEDLLGSGGAAMRALFARYAPTWLLQMPELFTPEELSELGRTTTASTSQRMQREFERAIESATSERTVVLVLEDLHWSDAATVELLWALAARREPARLMVIGTYRAVDAIADRHPILRMKRELTGKKQCVEIPLDGLETEAVSAWLDLTFAGHRLPAEFATRLHAQTSGNPLFVLNALAHFEQLGWLSRNAGAWTCNVNLDTLDAAVPDGTRDIVSFRLDQLPPTTREVLEAASIAGETFATQAVAAAIERDCEDVEHECAGLSNTLLLRDRGDIEWPDGTRGRAHEFRHALYRQVLATRLAPTRRKTLHTRIAARIEAGYGDRSNEAAGPLSFHHEHAGNWLSALERIDVLVSQAYARRATQEVEALTERALALARRLPRDPAGELRLLRATVDYAMALSASRGALSTDAARVFDDARALGRSIPTSPEHILSNAGVAVGALLHGDLRESRRIGEELLALAGPDSPGHVIVHANLVVGNARLHAGEVDAAIEHLHHGVAVLENDAAAPVQAGTGASVGIRAALGTALTVSGRGESGWASILQAVEAAKAAETPVYQGFALATASAAATFRRDPELARRYSKELIACCDAHGLPYWSSMQRLHLAWADAIDTRDPACRDALALAIEEVRPTVRLGWPRAFSLFADACLAMGLVEDASRALDEAFDPRWEEQNRRRRALASACRGAARHAARRCRAASAARPRYLECPRHPLVRLADLGRSLPPLAGDRQGSAGSSPPRGRHRGPA